MLNNIKGKLILKIIFSNLKKRKKLNIIKYNKRIQNLLSIGFENYLEFKHLNEMNIKFDLNIKDTDIEVLNLSDKNLDDEIFQNLSQIHFTGLKEVNLSFNKIKNIRGFINENFKKLEILNLYGNQITDINALETLSFERLKDLCLSYNKAKDITVFEK